MTDHLNEDATMLDHIHSALVGELPSFAHVKESKLQHLMQRNAKTDPQNHNEFDTSLSVEAKAFQPSSDANMKRLQGADSNPISSGNDFIPRNTSAPLLNQNQQNGNFNIPEFIPSRVRSRSNLSQQQQDVVGTSVPSQSNPVLFQQNNSRSYSDITTRMTQHQANAPRPSMLDYVPGGAPLHGTHLQDSPLFPTPPPQNDSINYFSGDGNTPLAVGHGKDRTSSRDLRASFRVIEEYVQKLLTEKSKKNARTMEMKGFSAPKTSSPFPRQQVDVLSTKANAPDRTSPLLARRMGGHHRNSPLSHGSTGLNINFSAAQSDANLVQQPMARENGGTTYFFTQKPSQQTAPAMVMPSYNIFPGPSPNIEYMKVKANAPSFFMPIELRQAIMQKHALTMLTVDTEQDSSVPAEVDNYHSLFPLEPTSGSPLPKSSTFGFVTSCYKAIKYRDGLPYCLRRIHGFRQVNEQCMTLVEMWKKLQHANVVQLREVFTSNAFGEHSLIFAHDYHAGGETLMFRHFRSSNNNYALKAKWNGGTSRQNAGLLPESLIWTYVVQLTSALRSIHAAGLACRVMDPTKIIITDKSRIRINGVGVFDVLGYDNTNANPHAHVQQYQQDDMMALGKVVLALACNSVTSIQPDNLQKSIELVVMNYSSDLKNLILYLLSPQQRPYSVNDVMPMIGARFYTQLDAAMLRGDVIANELAKEIENGRLLRMLSKLGVINERPEFGMEPSWSETGDRYLLKLFRDHLFHQVTDTGAPWVDLPHIVQCLNKLDAGLPEKICLMSRDEQNVLVVSYAELKKAYTSCFTELVQGSSSEQAGHKALS